MSATRTPPIPRDIAARRARRELPLLVVQQDLGQFILSTNDKTGLSVNLPIVETCEPSDVCRRVCYACAGWYHKTVVQKHAVAVLQWFRRTPAALAAAAIAAEFDARAKGGTALRWNGSGDLVPETVAVINHLARSRPDLTQVVYSRKPAQINALAALPAIVVNVSLDRDSLDLPGRVARPSCRYTYLRESAEDVPPPWSPAVPLEVVFPVRRAGYECLPHDARDCGADTGRMPLKGACEACRRCYRHPDETYPVYAESAVARGARGGAL